MLFGGCGTSDKVKFLIGIEYGLVTQYLIIIF